MNAPVDIVVLENVKVPMRDGVQLEADVYLPANRAGALPVLLERTPYDRRGTNHADRSLTDPKPKAKPEIAAQFVRAGYAYVLQDCRGRFGSGGVFVKYLSEGEDGFDTIGWLRDQPWCDGRIGTLGLSYGAHVQTALAAHDPPGLSAMFIDSGGFSSAYHSGIRQGGAFELKQLTWAMKHALLAPETARNPARRAALEAADIREWIKVNPWRRGWSPLAVAPEYEEYILAQWAHERFDSFWKKPELWAIGSHAAFADVPMVHMSSWYDPYARTACENYRGLSQLKLGPVKLVLGPWTHGQRSVAYAGDVDFGAAAPLDGNLAPDYVSLRRAWFDHTIKRIAAPEYLAAPVTIFVMGGGSGRRTPEGRLDHGGRWRKAADWPVPESRAAKFFLQPNGGLSTEPPQAAETRRFRFDPRDPVPTIGGAIASGAPLMEAGAFDQRESASVFGATVPGRALADREDVLVFETETLAEPCEVIGPITAHLFVSSSAADTDFTVKLVDLHPPNEDYPRGYAMNLTHGILRLRFRNGFAKPEPSKPHQIHAVTIEAFPTANRFLAGHRIRLEVSSSNFPHFDVNPNTGAAAGEASAAVVAENAVHLGPDRPSHLLLPLVPLRD